MTTQFPRKAPSVAVALLCVALASSSANAQGVDTNDPGLPPTVGFYFDPGPVTYPFALSGFDVTLNDISVDSFTSILHTPSGSDDVVSFNTVSEDRKSVV